MNETTTKYYSVAQAAAIVGQSYDRVRYAVLSGAVVPAIASGKVRLFTRPQLDELKTYFAERKPYYEYPYARDAVWQTQKQTN